MRSSPVTFSGKSSRMLGPRRAKGTRSKVYSEVIYPQFNLDACGLCARGCRCSCAGGHLTGVLMESCMNRGVGAVSFVAQDSR